MNFFKKSFLVCLTFLVVTLAACSDEKDNFDYWFSELTEELVEYDKDEANFEDAGYFYYLTSNVDLTVDITLRLNGYDYMRVFVYLNDEYLEPKDDTLMVLEFDELKLTTGDKLTFKFTANSTSEAVTEKKTISEFFIKETGEEYSHVIM